MLRVLNKLCILKINTILHISYIRTRIRNLCLVHLLFHLRKVASLNELMTHTDQTEPLTGLDMTNLQSLS
jgi:hypothetical protein